MTGKRKTNLIVSLALSLWIGIGEVAAAGSTVYAGEQSGNLAVQEMRVTAEASGGAKLTEVPEAHDSAEPTEIPGGTEVPEPTEVPEEQNPAEPTEMPGETEVPEESGTTEGTESVGKTEESETTEETGSTEETEESETTEEPAATEGTEIVGETEESESTEETGTTESTGETEESEETESTEETEETEETEPTEVPEETEDAEHSAAHGIRGAGFGAAGTIPPNGSCTYTAESAEAAYFKVEVTQKGYFSVSATATTKADKCGSYMVVNGGLKPLTDSRSVEYNKMSGSGRIGVEPGTYYVVYTKTGSAKVTVQFQCRFTAADDWESEDNDSFQTADEILTNKQYNGNTLTGISENGGSQEDYFKFTLPKNGAVKIDFLHDIYKESGQYYTVSLYNGSYEAITAFSVTGGNAATHSAQTGLAAGTYYICIKGTALAGRENTEYRFQAEYTASGYFERENNDNVTTATEIAANKTYWGSLKSLEDVDFYKVTLAKAGYVCLKFGHAQLANVSENYYHVYLYGADGATVYSEFDSKGNSVEYSDTKIGLPAGTYYVKVVFKGNYDNGTYSVRMSYKESSSWEKESNDNVNLANKLSMDKWYHGALSSAEDQDYYKFSIDAAGCIKIGFRHANLADSKKNYYIYLYDKKCSQLAVFSSGGFDESLSFADYGLPKGTYYLRVCAADGKGKTTGYSNSEYQIKVTYTKVSGWETEANNDFATADKLKLGTPVKGTTTKKDTDMYKFTLSGKTWVNISFAHADTGSTDKQWHVRLYDSRGNTVYNDARNKNVNAYMYVQGTGRYDTLCAGTGLQLAAGTYYVKVSDWVGCSDTPYKLTVSKVNVKAPTGVSAKSAAYNKVKLTWKAVSGADQYLIYRSSSKNGAYQKIAAVTGDKTSYTSGGLTSGKTYYYKLKAVGMKSEQVTSDYSKKVSAKPVPEKATVTLKAGKKQAAVSWKKVAGASGYEVFYCTKKDGSYKKVKTVTKGGMVKYTHKKLKSGRTYYYKVRAYRTVNGKKVYGSYSSVKSVKVK